MQLDRTSWRNVHFYDASNGNALGGFYQGGSLTESNFIWILQTVLLIAPDGFTVRLRETSRVISSSDSLVVPGNYDIYTAGIIQLTDEPWVPRILSYSVSGREDAFRDGIRARDGKCVISGRVDRATQYGVWAGFQAAHVFPLEEESLWIENGYKRWITNMDEVGNSRINSLQYGLLMDQSIHTCFDQYLFSINPDDGYKIVTFIPNDWNIDGRILDPVCRNPANPDHVSDHVLRWHFRQSVLRNMRGAGEPVFETDFPPGSDMMATLRTEPLVKKDLKWRLLGAKRKRHNCTKALLHLLSSRMVN